MHIAQSMHAIQGQEQAGLHGALGPRWTQSPRPNRVRESIQFVCVYDATLSTHPFCTCEHHDSKVPFAPYTQQTSSHSYQFAERLSTSGLLPRTIQSFRRLNHTSLAVQKDCEEEDGEKQA